MTAEVILLTGPPGSGKSTVAADLARGFARAVHLHTDDFWRAVVSGGVPPYLPEADAQNRVVMAAVAHAAFAYARGGFVVVVDGIVGPWMLSHFTVELGDPPPSVLHYVVLRATLDVTVARAVARRGSDDLTDTGPVVAMWEQFRDLGPLEHHVLDTTDQTPSQTRQAVRTAIDAGSHRLHRP